MNSPATLDADELALLQEIMNIAFGKAAAELAEVVDIFVVLSIPEVTLVPGSQLPALVGASLPGEAALSVVEQAFWGQFEGIAILVLPSSATPELVSLLGTSNLPTGKHLPPREMEKETLLEVGNILIGACVSKLAELLEDAVTYQPPMAVMDIPPDEAMPTDQWPQDAMAIVMKTLFRFSGKDIHGHLMLVTSPASMAWLRKALAAFLGRYA